MAGGSSLLLFVAGAWAHVGQPIGGIDLSVGPLGVEVEASWGLLIPDGDEWRWVCHEAITEPGAQRSPRYARGAEHRLGWMPDAVQGRGGFTLFHSPDGCAWDEVSGSDGRLVRDATYDPALPEVAWAAAGDEAWRSADGGATFEVAFTAADRELRGIRATTDGVVAVATDPEATQVFLLRFTSGGGLTEELLASGEALDARIGAVDGDDVFVIVDPFGADRVLRATRSSSGPASVDLVFQAAGQVTDLAWDGTTAWVVEDGIRLFTVRRGVVAPVASWPLGPGIDVVDGDVWGVPQSWVLGAMLTRSNDDGATFETQAFPDDVSGPLACAPETPVAQRCDPLWDVLLPTVRGYDDPPEDTGAPPPLEDPDRPSEDVVGAEVRSCGCGGSGGALPVAVGLVALLTRRAAPRWGLSLARGTRSA